MVRTIENQPCLPIIQKIEKRLVAVSENHLIVIYYFSVEARHSSLK